MFKKNGLVEVVPEKKWNWCAFFCGVFYLFLKCMCKWTLVYLVLGLGTVVISIYSNFFSNVLALILEIVLARNANDYYHDKLTNSGWKYIGEVEAYSMEEARLKGEDLLK